ncbi:MAG: hypothetical protein JST54_32690 [Deltaproteobacteria bacterium]|nr:hypothetical protein [Deltaproteobacteria bacterium]
MRTAPALVVVSLVVVFSSAWAEGTAPATGGAKSAAAAAQALESAQKALDAAVKKIEPDPPSNADLDAAHAAVEVLKKAIDDGAAFEEQDLEYAKAALAARKELRTQREYVDDRRAKVKIFDERRKIDAALAALNAAAAKTEPKTAGPKDFEDAHTAMAALGNELKAGQEFAKQDAKYAAYLNETEATLTKQQKAVDDRFAAIELDKHKVKVQAARDALNAAVAPLGKGGTDAQFDAALHASSDLTKLLDEGKPFESRDHAYKSDAEHGRNEIAAAKKKMDDYVASVGLAKLKADIEPARLQLVEAQKALHAKNPAPEALAEAKTAAFVVGKLVEKSQSKADASPAFAQYLEDTKKTLTDVEVQLQLRSLDSAKKDLNASMKNLDKRNATDDNFQEAKLAMTVLEKTLETVHAKEPALQGPVADARATLKDAKAKMELRRYQVDLTRAHDKLADALKTAEAACKKIWEAKVDETILGDAEKSVKALEPILAENKPFVKKDADYRDFDKKVTDRAKELTDRIAGRRVQLAAGAGRNQLSDLVDKAKAALDVAQKPEATDAEVDAAQKAFDAIQPALDANAKLEKQDKGYAEKAERAREQQMRIMDGLGFAKDAHALRKALADALAAGNTAVDAGSKSKDPNTQKSQYESAIKLFKSCAEDGASMVAQKPPLAKVVVLVNGSPNMPKEVMALCTQRSEATQPLLDQSTALAYFHNGPQKDYETAKAAQGKGDKTAAASQYGECIADGRIFAQRYPKLKDDKFEVAGASFTVGQLVDECVKQKAALK